jgi:hypothetical protein
MERTRRLEEKVIRIAKFTAAAVVSGAVAFGGALMIEGGSTAQTDAPTVDTPDFPVVFEDGNPCLEPTTAEAAVEYKDLIALGGDMLTRIEQATCTLKQAQETDAQLKAEYLKNPERADYISNLMFATAVALRGFEDRPAVDETDPNTQNKVEIVSSFGANNTALIAALIEFSNPDAQRRYRTKEAPIEVGDIMQVSFTLSRPDGTKIKVNLSTAGQYPEIADRGYDPSTANVRMPSLDSPNILPGDGQETQLTDVSASPNPEPIYSKLPTPYTDNRALVMGEKGTTALETLIKEQAIADRIKEAIAALRY